MSAMVALLWSEVFTFTFMTLVSMSAWEITAVMCVGFTGSIHTVCQIPVTAVYQIWLGLEVCFPLDW